MRVTGHCDVVHAAAAGGFSLFQSQGSSSTSRLCGVPAIRASTSASQACGSTSLSLAVAISVVHGRSAPAAPIGAGEEPVLASQGNRAVILPMSGRMS